MDFNIPINERVKAIEYCKIHLKGHWRDVQESCVSVSKLRGGLSNLLYRCTIIDKQLLGNKITTNNELSDVLLRLYGPTYKETVDCETQLEVFKKLASVKLGPKLYCHFDNGRLEEYLPSNALSWEQMRDNDISAVIAKKIASIHKLDLSYCLEKGSWLLNQFQEFYEFLSLLKANLYGDDNAKLFSSLSGTTLEIAKEMLYGLDFKTEIEFMKMIIEKLEKTLVFSHNDLHQNNILILDERIDEDCEHNNKEQNDRNIRLLDNQIVLIDFEFCSYNYRGFDLANHLTESCFDYTGDEYPNYKFHIDEFPSDDKQRQFLKHYAERLLLDKTQVNYIPDGDCTVDNDINNLVEMLFKEIQPHFMTSNLLWCLWAIKSACTSNISFGYWEMAKSKWDIYVMCKNRYQNCRNF